ncbi:hypothetical protein BDR03DRAFT_948854, partial [Suillus americanus]
MLEPLPNGIRVKPLLQTDPGIIRHPNQCFVHPVKPCVDGLKIRDGNIPAQFIVIEGWEVRLLHLFKKDDCLYNVLDGWL